MDYAVIRKLTVLDQAGVPKPVPGRGSRIQGAVRLAGGVGIAVEPDPAGAITLAVSGQASGTDDPYYLAKWRAVVNSGTGPGYSFSGVPYYISTMNRTEPAADGTLFLLGGVCSQLGLFSAPTAPSALPATLELFDMCPACVDCEDYQPLFTYTDRIEDWLDGNKDNNLTAGLKLFKQYQATVHYWNYLVHTQSLIFRAAPDGYSIRLKFGYRCLGCGPYPDVRVTLTVVQVSGTPIEGKLQRNGLAKEPDDLFVRLLTERPESTSSLSSGSVADFGVMLWVKDIDKNGYAVADITYKITGPANMSSSSSSVSADTAGDDYNVYDVTVTWLNTHLGTAVSRSKTVKVQSP